MKRHWIVAAAIVAALTALGLPASASASTGASTGEPGAGSGGHTVASAQRLPTVGTPAYIPGMNGKAIRIGPRPETSAGGDAQSTWSGYEGIVCSTCQLRYVTATYTVPSVNCADSDIGTSGYAFMYLWTGLDGFEVDGSVEQDGIAAYCSSTTGPASYYAWYDICCTGPGLQIPDLATPIQAKDEVSSNVEWDTSTDKYEFSFDDITKDEGWTESQACPSGSTCENKTAETVIEIPDGGPPYYDVPDFGSDAISNDHITWLDGTKGDLCGASGKSWEESSTSVVDAAGNTDVYPSAPPTTCSGPDGFTEYFKGSD